MTDTENEDIDLITSDETEETSEYESQETLESEETEYLTPQAQAYKEKRREENRQARDALKEVPLLKAELEKQKFFKGNPDAETYEKEIDEFRAGNPNTPLDKAFRYVLADVNPAKLAELTDPGLANQARQSRTTLSNADKSFSEQTGEQPITDAQLERAALKEWAKLYG